MWRSYLPEEQGLRNWSGSVWPFSTRMHICEAPEISKDSRGISADVWFIKPACCALEKLLFRGCVGRMWFTSCHSIARLPNGVFWKVFINRISVIQDPLLRFHKYFMWGSRDAWRLEEEESGGFSTTAVAVVAVGKSIEKSQWDYSYFRNCQVALRESETPSEGLDLHP